MATLGSSASLTQTDYEDGTVFERTSSLFSPRPIKDEIRNRILCGFLPLFRRGRVLAHGYTQRTMSEPI
jgi:hypothetical protein